MDKRVIKVKKVASKVGTIIKTAHKKVVTSIFGQNFFTDLLRPHRKC